MPSLPERCARHRRNATHGGAGTLPTEPAAFARWIAFPNNGFLPPELYNQIFTVHGSVMMFLFAVPIFEAFSIMILPEMIGARDLPFPRLSAFGF